MLPRLLSPQFGLLDDGVSIITSRNILKNPLEAFQTQRQSGRFVPMYWLFMAIVLRLSEYSPIGAYFIKWAMLFFTAIIIFIFLRWRGLSNLSSTISCALFITSAPSIENYYTFSKSEPMVTLWIFAGLLTIIKGKQIKQFWGKILFLFLTTVFFWMSYHSKEPTLIVTVIFFFWMIAAKLQKSESKVDRFTFQAARTLFLITLSIFIIWLTSRYKFLGGGLDQGYASNYQISPDVFSAQLWKWLGYFLRDYIYLLPLSLLLVINSFRKCLNFRLLFDFSVWIIGWVIILLPWGTLDIYYTLQVSLGMSMIAGVLIDVLIKIISSQNSQRSQADIYWGAFCLTLSITLLSISFVNNITLARTQLIIDNENAKMVNYLSHFQPNQEILFNTPFFEYVHETQIHLNELYHRKDLSISILDYPYPTNDEPLVFYVVSPIAEKFPMPDVRSNLQNVNGVKHWSSCYKSHISSDAIPVYSTIATLNWLDIGFNRLLPHMDLKDPISSGYYDSFVLQEEFIYGWEIFKHEIDPNNIAQPGTYRNGTWLLKLPTGHLVINNFGDSETIPLTGDFDGNGWTDLGVFNSSSKIFQIDTNLDGQINIELSITGMQNGDIPIIGDWDGDGIDTIGFFRPEDTSWNLRNTNSSGPVDNKFLIPGAIPTASPLIGDWDGDGIDTFGMYISSEAIVVYDNNHVSDLGFRERYFMSEDISPVVADWYGFGKDTIAIVNNSVWIIRPNNQFCEYHTPLDSFTFGDIDGIPIAGRWKSQ